MRSNSMFAFIFTLVALVLMSGLLAYLAYGYLSNVLLRGPDYCEHFSVDLVPESYSTILEIGKGQLIKVNMTNNGFDDEFKINADGPRWVVTRPLKVRLGQGESEDLFVYMSPDIGSEGNYTIAVFAISYCRAQQTEIKVKV